VLRVLLIFVSLLAITAVKAQERDSAVVRQDTIKPVAPKAAPVKSAPVVKSPERIRLEKMPRRAAIRSAIIPGWGQMALSELHLYTTLIKLTIRNS